VINIFNEKLPNHSLERSAMSDQLIPLNMAFAELSISRPTGYRLISKGLLEPVVKIGSRSYIKRSDLDRFKAALPVMKSARWRMQHKLAPGATHPSEIT
jgi:predicted DNA-binding transcriptional regulator AlpA